MTADNGLLDNDAVAMAALVRRGEATPRELVGAAIAAIETWNPVLNAVVSERFEEALKDADATDRDAPFAGVPLLVKDNQDCVGLPTRAGSRYREGAPAASGDHPLVARLRHGGFIPVAKTNMPEMGLLPTTEPELYGPCHNPFGLDRMCGGSSGGSAAAVAARLVPVATASDGGGSIRIPAAACGTVGLKPSRSRTPGAGWGGLAVNGVVTRSVRDSAAVLDLLAGRGRENPAPLPVPEGGFLTALSDRGGALRIAVAKGFGFGRDPEPEVWEAVEATARLLAELGHSIEEETIDLAAGPFGPRAEEVYALVPTALARQVALWQEQSGIPAEKERFEPLTWWFIERGRDLGAMAILAAYDALALLAAETAELFDRYDVILTPTVRSVAPPIGSWSFPPDDPLSGWPAVDAFMPPYLTQLANFLGHPALSLPLYESTGGLPIGIQLYGRFAEEATLLTLAAALEDRLPWSARVPALTS